MHKLFINFNKSYYSVRGKVLYDILTEFGIPMKLLRLIKMCVTEKYNRARVGKHLSDTYPTGIYLKQGDALSPLLFNFVLENAIRVVQENQDGLKLDGTHQLLIFANDANMLVGSVYNIKENTETLLVCSKETGLEVSVDVTKYMIMSRDQNAGRSHNIKIDNSSFERVKDFKCLGKP